MTMRYFGFTYEIVKFFKAIALHIINTHYANDDRFRIKAYFNYRML